MTVLHSEHSFSDLFVAYLVSRNNQIQEDPVDQLFNSAEKRLARILLLLARFRKEARTENVIPKTSQETLAEVVGTTRVRVNFFMKRIFEVFFKTVRHPPTKISENEIYRRPSTK